MKKLTLIEIIFIFIFLGSVCNAKNKGLLELITDNPSYENVLSYLENTESHNISNIRTNVAIKPMEESGEIFAGHVKLTDRTVDSISLWTSKEHIAPNDARVVFANISKKIASYMGEGTLIETIPNYEDATEVSMNAFLWKDKEDIIVLMIAEYPDRAGVSITREDQTKWLENMGADSGIFWTKTLQSFNHPRSPDSSENSNPTEQIPDLNNKEKSTNLVGDNLSKNQDMTDAESRDVKRFFPWLILTIVIFLIMTIKVVISKKKKY